MVKKKRVFKCEICGRIVEEIVKSNSKDLKCCGKPMTQLKIANKREGKDKHKPVIKLKKRTLEVLVGETEHPMTRNHLIKWVEIITNKKTIKKIFSCKDKPYVKVILEDGEKPLFVLAYCNLHGLWQTTINTG